MRTYAQHPSARQVRKLGIFAPAKTFAEIERRIASLKTTKERGDAFENFAEGYLVTQRVMSAKSVWVNTEIPASVLKKLNIPRGGAGIDGIYENRDSDYVPYQVKFRERRPNLTLDELGGFYALSSQAKTKLLFTNTDSVSPHAKSRSGYISVRGSDLDRLTPEEIGAICAWARGEKPRPEKRSPRPYQEAALKDIARGLDKQDRATAVMACGTGKTLVALWAAERQKPKTVLVLLPSLALLSQTLKEWALFTTWGDRFHYLCVCSDPSVSKGGDEWSMAPEDLNFRVGTDPKEVRRFLTAKGDAVRVVFSTYQSSRIVAKGMKGLRPFDFGIFDEAHKTAGREGANFSFALKDKNLPIRKRLFLTATPRHYDIRKRNKAGDFAVTSMDDEKVYGPVVHKLTFGKAADQGIICRYKVIISVIDSDTLDREGIQKSKVMVAGKETYANWVATQLALKRAVRRTAAKRIITFHRDVKAARTFAADDAEGIKSYLPNFTINHVNGTQPVSDREAALKEFKEVERGLITNARCLTEGVDVPSVDMVAFMSPRKSRVDIVQAVGRAMRKADGKRYGYLLVPLFLERRKGETLQQAFERSDFDEVATVINAMQEQDEDLAEIIRELRQQKGETGGFNESHLKEKIEVLGPQVSLSDLRLSISTRIVDRLGSNWDEMYGRLVAYQQQYDSCNVPLKWDADRSLGIWVNGQRTRYNQGKLDRYRQQQLEKIKFDWNPIDTQWEVAFTHLSAFKVKYGHCRVPQEWPKNPSLGSWCLNQRQDFRKGTMPSTKVRRLTTLGFSWDPDEEKWGKSLNDLREFKVRYGHTNVPSTTKTHKSLAAWCDHQRRRLKRGLLEKERRALLDEIGFVWEPHQNLADTMLDQLRAFQDKRGHCRIPHASVNNAKLRSWCRKQRAKYKAGILDKNLIAELDKIGFEWAPFDSAWIEAIEHLKKFKNKAGHTRVPLKFSSDAALGAWCNRVRRDYRLGKLSEEKVRQLNDLNYEWEPRGSVWSTNYSELQAFKKRHGHVNVPAKFPANQKLATWCTAQRTRSKGGQMSQAERSMLQAIGFEFDLIEAKWKSTFNALIKFKKTEGHLRVPQSYKSDGLGAWCNWQRSQFRRGNLRADRAKLLRSIGFAL